MHMEAHEIRHTGTLSLNNNNFLYRSVKLRRQVKRNYCRR